jgi:hypothetical protein
VAAVTRGAGAFAATFAAASIALACVAGAPSPARAATLRVPAEQPTIGAGLALAALGDTVLVAPGTYAERVSLRSGVVLRADGPPGSAIIDAALGGSCVSAIDCGTGTRLEGFRLVRGRGEAQSGSTVGGALRVLGGVLRAADCTFDDAAATFGGGSAAAGAFVVLERCAWTGCSASFGGGHFQSAGELTLVDATFTAPHASAGGALFATNGARVNVDRALVAGATSTGDGAGMRFDTCVATLAHARLEDNVAGGRGGGIAVAAGGQVLATFCTLLRNRSGQGGGAVHVSCSAAAPGAGPADLLAADCALLSLAQCDILSSAGPAPAAGEVTDAGVLRLHASIVAGNASGLACTDSRATLAATCSDLYGNNGPDLSGNCAPATDPSNRAVDPYLCNLSAGDVGLCANSPLVDPGCGDSFWGASGVTCGDCGPTPARAATWGRLKVRYRD